MPVITIKITAALVPVGHEVNHGEKPPNYESEFMRGKTQHTKPWRSFLNRVLLVRCPSAALR
jgi:hypothetical protein